VRTLVLERRFSAFRVGTLSLDTAVQAAALALAAAAVAAFAVAAFFRLSYPYPLQVAEPPSLTEIERITHGQPLYVQPTLAYVPEIYGPLYFYISAAVALLVGDSYAPLRLVSALASLGTMLLIGWLVRRETGSWAAGLLAAGVYAASFPLSGTTLDLGRVDALFTCFLFGAIYAARRAALEPAQVGRSLALSGCLLGLAALTKLPLGALPVAVGICVSSAFAHRQRAALFLLAAAATVAAGLVLVRALGDAQWPTWYMWDLPRLHEVRPDLVGRFWFQDVLPRLSIGLLFGPVFVLVRLLQRDARPLVFYSMVSGSVLALSWISRANGGGATNVLLPVFALAGLLLGLGIHSAVAEIGGRSVRAQAFRAYLFGLCLVQFGLLAYNPRLTVPYRSDQWADDRLAAKLASLPAPILAGDLDGYMHADVQSVHPMTAPIGELQGEFGGHGTPEGRSIDAAIREQLAAHQFRYVVVYDKTMCCFADVAASYGYRDMGPLFPPGDVFYEWKSSRTPEPELLAAPS
jgi:Dolichyl-phosphate-mannose-protein mannosyltransferase